MTLESVRIACPACNAINRVPQARLADAPNCGKCRAPLFTSHPLALDATGFHAHGERAGVTPSVAAATPPSEREAGVIVRF